MRRLMLLSLALPALLMAVPSRASASGLDLRIGGFFPRGRDCGIPSAQSAEYTLFQDVCELYVPVGRSLNDTNWISELNGVYGGAEFNVVVAPYVEVGVSLDGSSRSVDTSYRDYTRPDGTEIQQRVHLSTLPLGATVRFLPTSKHTRIVPYVGGGVDAIFYHYEETGDFIDFTDPALSIVPDTFKDDGAAFGFHAVGGLRVYLNRDFAIAAEGRYQWAGKDMGHDFSPNAAGLVNRIDLSGWTATVGLHVRF